MPTYAYRCRDCGHELEVHQGFADSALTECPVCGGVLRKQYGTVGVTFNGSGFYRTDSRAGEQGGTKKGESGDNGSGAKESGSKDAGSNPSAPKADTPKKDAPKPAAAPSTSA